MPPTDKARAAGVSAGSFLELKAHLAKQEEEFTKNKAAGKTTLVGGVKRPDKKPTVWARHNKGVTSRAARDIELEEISKPTIDAARAVLERKAQIYEKLSKGKSGGLNDKQFNSLLVDFDLKPTGDYESDSDDVDESLTVPQPPGNSNDPMIEYEDEFGRIRTARQSDIPRHLLPKEYRDEEEEDFDPYVIHNPVNHFPIYEQSEERLAAIDAQLSEENNPLNVHYDASQEVRTKGAGFMQFSGDEETRRRQQEELERLRDETKRNREMAGAMDLRPGEYEGMVAPEGEAAGGSRSRAQDKRKREIEERRALLEAKRRKKNTATPLPTQFIQESNQMAAQQHSKQENIPTPTPSLVSDSAVADPFAILEAQSKKGSAKGKTKNTPGSDGPSADPADAFLASLEQDFMRGTRR